MMTWLTFNIPSIGTHWRYSSAHTDATQAFMFSVATMLPMSDESRESSTHLTEELLIISAVAS